MKRFGKESHTDAHRHTCVYMTFTYIYIIRVPSGKALLSF